MSRYGFRGSPLLPPVRARVEERVEGPSLDKDYPRVYQAIQAMWGFKELNEYFRKRTLDERGNREGFPPEVWEEIYLLMRIHEIIVPEYMFQNTNFRTCA